MKIHGEYASGKMPFRSGTAFKLVAIDKLMKGIRHLFYQGVKWSQFSYHSIVFLDRAMKFNFREEVLPKLFKNITSVEALFEMAYKKDKAKTLEIYLEVMGVYSRAQSSILKEKIPSKTEFADRAELLIGNYTITYEKQLGTLLSMVVGCRRIVANEEVYPYSLADEDTTEKIEEVRKSLLPLDNPIKILSEGCDKHLRNASFHGVKVSYDNEREEITIKDRNYIGTHSIPEVTKKLEDMELNVDALEIAILIFNMNHAKELFDADKIERPLSQDEFAPIIDAVADSMGFKMLEAEDIEKKQLWIHLERKAGTVSTEESESEVTIGYKSGRYEKFPIKEPAMIWKTKDQLLGFVVKVAPAVLTRSDGLIVELDNLGKKNSLRIQDLKGFMVEIRPRQRNKKRIEEKYVSTDLKEDE